MTLFPSLTRRVTSISSDFRYSISSPIEPVASTTNKISAFFSKYPSVCRVTSLIPWPIGIGINYHDLLAAVTYRHRGILFSLPVQIEPEFSFAFVVGAGLPDGIAIFVAKPYCTIDQRIIVLIFYKERIPVLRKKLPIILCQVKFFILSQVKPKIPVIQVIPFSCRYLSGRN